MRSFLAGDRTPMWFTVLLLGAGAFGTYYLAPQVNAKFEAQKIRTDFVIRNYGDLRTKMEDFQGLYSVTAQKLVTGDGIEAEVFKLQEIVGRVTAQNLSLLPMFTTEGGPKAAAEVNAAMNGMLNVIFANAGKKIDSEQERAAARSLPLRRNWCRRCLNFTSVSVKSGVYSQRKKTRNFRRITEQAESVFEQYIAQVGHFSPD